jgi:hypothetical protein
MSPVRRRSIALWCPHDDDRIERCEMELLSAWPRREWNRRAFAQSTLKSTVSSQN